MRDRKAKSELRPGFRVLAEADAAAVPLDDAPHDRETEAGAGGLGGEEGLKHFLARVRRNARAIIFDAQDNRIIIGAHRATIFIAQQVLQQDAQAVRQVRNLEALLFQRAKSGSAR